MSVVKTRRNSGFSLVELVTVILLLGILSVFALGTLVEQDDFEARGYFDDTVTAVRFAQKFAISSGCDVRVVVAAKSYSVRQSSACAANDFTGFVPNPADRGNNYQNTLGLAAFNMTAGNITFDARGAREEASSTFSLTDGTTTYQFTVHASTGLVEVL
ncbi:MAG: type II secretion system protein [Pseudomonadota bacterium]